MKKIIFLLAAAVIVWMLIVSAANTDNANKAIDNNTANSSHVNTNSNGCKLIGSDTCQDWNNGMNKINQGKAELTNKTNEVTNALSNLFK